LTDIYFKCSFDVFVRLDEETARKIEYDTLLLVSAHVAKACNSTVKRLNDASKETSEFETGEITTKYISARQGEKKFGSGSPNA
jgi:hypothetical protein